MRKLTVAALCLIMGIPGITPAQAFPAINPPRIEAQQQIEHVQWRGRGGYYRGGYHGGHHHNGSGWGWALGGLAVGTIIGDAEGRILLVRRAIEPGYGKWVFPGGYVDRGEQVLAAAQREAREESGLAVRVDDLVDIYSYPGRTPIIIVFAATLIGGDVQVDDEGLEARWFGAPEVPWSELAFRSTHEAIRDYFEGRRHPLRSITGRVQP